MCAESTKRIIENVIIGKMKRREKFTAYEITLIARHQGMTERHNDVRHDIHSIIETLMAVHGYSKTTVKISDEIGHARMYYPTSGVVTTTPTLKDTTMVTSTSDMSSPTPDPVQVSRPVTNPSFPGYDRRGRLNVSTGYVREAGYEEGDMVGVVVGTDMITIQPDVSIGVPYRVSCDDNIRLAPVRIKEAFGGFPSSLNYLVDFSTKTIIITK